MQDIHSIGGGRIFSGGGGGGGGGGVGGGGDRRLRPHHHHNQQALKCPRCDSLNTKFCYYNNYNLSQPRHFCKSCRRYWTKGGVLRNVPVGGGCRKAKRSKTKPPPETVTAAAASAPPQQPQQQQQQQQHCDQQKANSHSSSESSSLTAANSNVAATNNDKSSNTTAAATNNGSGGGGEAVSAVTSHPNLINVSEQSKFYGNPNNLGFEPGLLGQGSDCGIFSEIGSFTSLIASSNNETLSFGFGTVLNGQGLEQGQWQQQQQQKMMSSTTGVGEEISGGLLDQTVQVELPNLHSRLEGGFGALDWQGSGDQGLFDLPNAVVDQSYWSQSQWTSTTTTDQDHSTLYLP